MLFFFILHSTLCYNYSHSETLWNLQTLDTALTSPLASCPCRLCSLLCLPRWQLQQLKFAKFISNSFGYS